MSGGSPTSLSFMNRRHNFTMTRAIHSNRAELSTFDARALNTPSRLRIEHRALRTPATPPVVLRTGVSWQVGCASVRTLGALAFARTIRGQHKPTYERNTALKLQSYASPMIDSRLRWVPALLLSVLALLPTACKSEKSDDAATSDSAQPLASGELREHKGKRELPPAAFDACQGKAVGDACTVTFGTKQMEAKCAAAPDGRLACRREREKPEGS
jgi:hypothetical protein